MVSPLDNKAQVAVSIGSKIRALRQRLKRTLDEVATIAGFSKPFLSQVERGHATPSISSLVGIARALGARCSTSFMRAPTEDRSVRRESALKYFGFDGSADLFGRMTNLAVGGQLEAFLIKMPKGLKPSEVTTHPEEEFCMS